MDQLNHQAVFKQRTMVAGGYVEFDYSQFKMVTLVILILFKWVKTRPVLKPQFLHLRKQCAVVKTALAQWFQDGCMVPSKLRP